MALPSLPETSSWPSEGTDTALSGTDSERQMSSEEHPDQGHSGHPRPVQNEAEAFEEPEGSVPSHPNQDEPTAPTTLSENPVDKSSTKPPEESTTVTALPAKEDRSPTDMFLCDRDKETYREIISSLDKYGQSGNVTNFQAWSNIVASTWGGLLLKTPEGERPLSAQDTLIRLSELLPQFRLKESDMTNITTLEKNFAQTFPVPSIERERTVAWMRSKFEAVTDRFSKRWQDKYDEFTGKKPPEFEGFNPTLPEGWYAVVEPSLASVPEEPENDTSNEEITVCPDTEQCARTGPSTDMPCPPTNTLPDQTRVTQAQTANPPSFVRSESHNAHRPKRSMTSFVTDSTAHNSTITTESDTEKDQRPAKRLKSSLATDDKVQDHTTIPATTSAGLDSTLPGRKTTSNLKTTSPPRRRKMTAFSGSSTAVPSTAPPEASKQNPRSTVPERPARPTARPAETKRSTRPVSPQSKRLTFEPKNDSPASAWLTSFRTMFDKANGMERQLAPTTWLGEPRTFKARKGDYECTGSCESNGRLLKVTCDVRRGKESLWRTQQAWNMVGKGGYQFRVDWTGKKTLGAKEPSTSELYKEFSQVVQDTGLAVGPWPAPFKMEGAVIWDNGNVDHGELPWTLLHPLKQTVTTLVS